ncbi:transposable element Tcb1 transposase [Trichonephila clavipes]|nr:transposable element Tcb1 transposase [Trichonephila clavipes]
MESLRSTDVSIASFIYLIRQWCDERWTWTTKWINIVFTDESRFFLQHDDDRIRVGGHRDERLLNCCVMHRHTGLASGIMIRGGTGFHCLIPLVRNAGTMNNQRYISEVFSTHGPPIHSALAINHIPIG